AFGEDILEHLPHLRAFARLLARDRTFADDLVQEALLRALSHADQFRTGTNLRAWLTAILRNCYFDEQRSRRRTVQLDDTAYAREASPSQGQGVAPAMGDLEGAFAALPAIHREALALVGASSFSYEQAAALAKCPVGTMKSRIFRARAELQRLMDGGSY